MTYFTIKIIKGNPYLYEVRSEREGDKVRQIFVAYLGRADRGDRIERRPAVSRAKKVVFEPGKIVPVPAIAEPEAVVPEVVKEKPITPEVVVLPVEAKRTAIEKKAIKTYGTVKQLSPYQGSYILEDGRLLNLDDAGHRELGINDFGRQTGGLRLRVTPNEVNVDFIQNIKPTQRQLNQIEQLSIGKSITYGIVDEKDKDIIGEVGTTFDKMADDINKFYTPIPEAVTPTVEPEKVEPEVIPTEVVALPVSKEVRKQPWEMTKAERAKHIEQRGKESIQKWNESGGKGFPPSNPERWGVAEVNKAADELEMPWGEGRVAIPQHKYEVMVALKQGKPIPLEVLADYPDLAPSIPEEVKPVISKEVSPEVSPTERLKLFHGTKAEFADADIDTRKKMFGIHLTTDEAVAKVYGDVKAFELSEDAKTLDLSDGEDLWAFMGKEGILDAEDLANIDLENYVKGGQLYQYDISSRTSLADDVAKTAQSKGYDLVKMPDNLGSVEGENVAYVVVNKEVLKATTPPVAPVVAPVVAPPVSKEVGKYIPEYTSSPEVNKLYDSLPVSEKERLAIIAGDRVTAQIKTLPEYKKLNIEAKVIAEKNKYLLGASNSARDKQIEMYMERQPEELRKVIMEEYPDLVATPKAKITPEEVKPVISKEVITPVVAPPVSKEVRKQPWEMTRREYRISEYAPKVDAIQRAISEGKPIILTTHLRATKLTKPEHIRLSGSMVQIPQGSKWVSLTDDQVQSLSEQAGIKPTPFEEKIYHHAEVEKAILEGKMVSPEVLKDYPELVPSVATTEEPEKVMPEIIIGESVGLPLVGETVSGLTVRHDIPNQASIESSLEDYEILKGIREIPTSETGEITQPKFYSVEQEEATRKLAEEIKASGEINPLILVITDTGDYILEGSHRLDALRILGIKSFPAQVVIDRRLVPEGIPAIKGIKPKPTVTPEVTPEEVKPVISKEVSPKTPVTEGAEAKTLFHGSDATFDISEFKEKGIGTTTTTFGQVETERHGIFLSESQEFASEYGKNVTPLSVNVKNTAEINTGDNPSPSVQGFIDSLDPFGSDRDLWLLAKNLKSGWAFFDGEVGARFTEYLKARGYDSASFEEVLPAESTKTGQEVEGKTLVVLDAKNIQQPLPKSKVTPTKEVTKPSNEIITISGRNITAPKIRTDTSRIATIDLQKANEWLLSETKKEVAGVSTGRIAQPGSPESTREFQRDLLDRMNPKKLTEADKATAWGILTGNPEAPNVFELVETKPKPVAPESEVSPEVSPIPSPTEVGSKITPEAKELLRRLDLGEWDIDSIPVNLEKIAYDNGIEFVGQNAQGIPSTPKDIITQLRNKAFTPVEVVGIKERIVLPERVPNHKLVNVDTTKFDVGFAKDTDFYISQGGMGATIGDRYSMFQDYIKTGKSIDAPEVFVSADGTVTFTNGRHRYAVLRDMGIQDIPVAMSRTSLNNAKKLGYIAGAKPPAPSPTEVTGEQIAQQLSKDVGVDIRAEGFQEGIGSQLSIFSQEGEKQTTFYANTIEEAKANYARKVAEYKAEGRTIFNEPIQETTPKIESDLIEGVEPLGSGDIASGWQKTYRGRMIYKADLAMENTKESIAYDKITNAPSYPKLLAAYKRHMKSLYSADDPYMLKSIQEAEREPWKLLTAHSGVMNAKSARAITLKNLAGNVFAETKLPRKPEGRFRGESGLDWDKVKSTVTAVTPTVTPKAEVAPRPTHKEATATAQRLAKEREAQVFKETEAKFAEESASTETIAEREARRKVAPITEGIGELTKQESDLLSHLTKSPTQKTSNELYLRKTFGDETYDSLRSKGFISRTPNPTPSKAISAITLKGRDELKQGNYPLTTSNREVFQCL